MVREYPTKILYPLLLACVIAPATASGQTRIDVQEVKELKPTGSLSTCAYLPLDREKEFLQKVPADEQVTGSFMDEHAYQIRGKKNRRVAWFGVVRGAISKNGDERNRKILIQQTYFDGLTDCHIMLVSHAGAGDFVAELKSTDTTLPALSLVRVYGTVLDDEDGIPHVSADYVRVWPWFTFTFTDLGPADHSNPKWAQYCKICKSGRIYKPYPTEDYYRGILGDPKDFLTAPLP